MPESATPRSALEARTIFRRGITLCAGPPFGQRLLPGQALLLLTVADVPGPHNTTSLAEVLGTSRPRASVVLAAMQAAGWIRKSRHRQQTRYHLTTLGQDLVNNIDVVLRGGEANKGPPCRIASAARSARNPNGQHPETHVGTAGRRTGQPA